MFDQAIREPHGMMTVTMISTLVMTVHFLQQKQIDLYFVASVEGPTATS